MFKYRVKKILNFGLITLKYTLMKLWMKFSENLNKELKLALNSYSLFLSGYIFVYLKNDYTQWHGLP